MFQFAPVTAAKFVPSRWVVSEPSTQLMTGRQVFQPGCKSQCRSGNTARSKTVHQVTGAVGRAGRFVDAFELDVHGIEGGSGHPRSFGHSCSSGSNLAHAASVRFRGRTGHWVGPARHARFWVLAAPGVLRGMVQGVFARGGRAGGAVNRSTNHRRKAGKSFHAVATRTVLPVGSMRVKPSSVTRSGRVSISQNSSETAR